MSRFEELSGPIDVDPEELDRFEFEEQDDLREFFDDSDLSNDLV